MPLLLDRDGYEGYAFSSTSENTTAEENADLQTFSRLFELYPSEALFDVLSRQTWFGDFIINCLTHYMATAPSDQGLPVCKLIFNVGSQQHGTTHSIIFNTSYKSSLLILIPKCALGGFADFYLTESSGQNGTFASIIKD